MEFLHSQIECRIIPPILWLILWILRRILEFIRLLWGGRQILYLLKNYTSASQEEEKWRNPRRYFARNLSKNIWRKQSFQYYQSSKFNNYNYFNNKNLIVRIEQYDFLNVSQYRFSRYLFRGIPGEIFILSLAILL